MGEFRGPDGAGKATEWKKGESGNPAGRPRTKHITEIYNELLDDGQTREEIKQSIRRMLLSGKMSAVLLLRDVGDRTEGKVSQQIEVSGDLSLTLSERMRKARERKQQPAIKKSDPAK